jgi:hypothetical protein
MRYIDDLDARYEDDFVTVVVPEFALEHWWQQLLHNQSALVLRTRLRSRPNTIVTSVPFHIEGDHDRGHPEPPAGRVGPDRRIRAVPRSAAEHHQPLLEALGRNTTLRWRVSAMVAEGFSE